MFAGFSDIPFSQFDEFRSFTHQQRRQRSFKYYDILGISRLASPSQIRKAFQQLARRVHPDKGGDPEKFKEINEAYEVLRDESKRRRYDEVGDEGIQEGLAQGSGGAGSTVDDLFEELFGLRTGRSRQSRRESRPRRGKDVFQTIEVPLEDIHNGVKRQLSVSGKCMCGSCKGTGFKGAVRCPCLECHGRGVKITVMHYSNGIVQETQRGCDTCGGSGLDSNPSNYCQVCCGAGEMNKVKTLDVYIEQGMPDGHEIRFHGEAPCRDTSMEPGDLVVIIRSLKHPQYKRKGCDLITKHKCGICEALCGVDFTLKQLDGRIVRMKSKPGEVIRPGHIKSLDGEGLPVHGQPQLKGNLYIEFEVVFPNNLLPQQQKMIQYAFQEGSQRVQRDRIDHGDLIDNIRDVSDLQDELNSREKFGRQNEAAYDSEDSDDHPHSNQRVQCSQQ